MEASSNQRAIVYFLWKEGSSASDIKRRLKNVFKESALKKTAVYNWISRFEAGRTSLEDNERLGRPSLSTSDDLVDQVKSLVQEDGRRAIFEISTILEVSVGSIHTILHEKLHMSKVCAR